MPKVPRQGLLDALKGPMSDYVVIGKHDHDSDMTKFMLDRTNLDSLPTSAKCECGTAILHQHYIWNSKEDHLLVVGSTCIKYFNITQLFFKGYCAICKTELFNKRRVKYCSDCNPRLKIVHKILERKNQQKIYFKIPYAQKDEGKRLGARWDPEKKLWYGNSDNEKRLMDHFELI